MSQRSTVIRSAAILKHSEEGAPGVTESDATTSDQLKSAQRIERLTQSSIPLLTGVLLVLNAQQGELQRPVARWLEDARRRAKRVVSR